jgi:hypothetical protein
MSYLLEVMQLSKRVTGFKAFLTGFPAMDSVSCCNPRFALRRSGAGRTAAMKTALGFASDRRCSALLLGSF